MTTMVNDPLGARAPAVQTVARERLDDLHQFRGLAILLILATHCVSFFDWDQHPLQAELARRTTANTTLLFVFIGGYLFDHLSRDRFDARDYWLKKLRFVAFPYLVISTPALGMALSGRLRPDFPQGFSDWPLWRQLVEMLGTGVHLVPFWFIPGILLLYLVAPLIRWAFQDRRAFVVMPLLLVLSLVIDRGTFQPWKAALHFMPIWVLGMAACRFRAQVCSWLAWSWPLFWLAAAVAMLAELAWMPGTHSPLSTLGKLMLAFALLHLVGQFKGAPAHLLELLGDVSFGLFFVHSYVITAGKLAWARFVGAPPQGNGLLLLLAIGLFTLFSYVLVHALIRLVGRNRSRMIVGV
ncbi:acyltransferase family protein [Inhella sp.]|uniref:acyltransferase family protein n=1 Tax=Inhella sp. TaxID=1921806 RepID=UPI0035B1FB3F